MVLFRGEVCTIASTLSNAATALCLSTGELSSHDETNTAEMIDQMFEEVLEYAGRMEEERRDNEDTEDRDSGIGNYSGDKSKMDTESEKERSEEEEPEGEGEHEEGRGARGRGARGRGAKRRGRGGREGEEEEGEEGDGEEEEGEGDKGEGE